MNFLLIETQEGGCDYTIGCGFRITEIRQQSHEEAVREAVDLLIERWQDADDDFATARLFEVTGGIDLRSEFDRRASIIRAEVEKFSESQERAEYERLRRKFEGNNA